MAREICLVASGDSRLTANRVCWPAQEALEAAVARAFAALGCTIVRGHPYDPVAQHGFLDGQARGIEAFRQHRPDGAAGRGRGGVAVHEPRAARA